MNSCGLQDNSDFSVAILPLLYGLQGGSMIDIAANAGRNDSRKPGSLLSSAAPYGFFWTGWLFPIPTIRNASIRNRL
jgi:hypothetical protein